MGEGFLESKEFKLAAAKIPLMNSLKMNGLSKESTVLVFACSLPSQ